MTTRATLLTHRKPRRAWLGLRARLILTCLMLLVVSGAVLMVFVNLLVGFKLSAIYNRPLVVVDLSSPTPQGEEFVRAKQAANDAADQAAATIRVLSLIGFVVVIAAGSGLCWLVCGRALKPLRGITALASRLSQDTLGERIAFDGPRDELKTLADSFDAMLDRLARAFDAQRLFVANASHELRAPLTVIRTAADLTLSKPARPETDYRRSLTTVEAAAQRSQRLLDSLLRLATTQHRGSGLEPVDLAEAARAAIGDHPPDQPRLHADLDPARTIADPALIDLLLRNLIDNAARYNQPDGWIRIHTAAHDDTATLTVESTGPLITADQARDLVRAFHRGQRTRTTANDGFGLGLAIVDAIVDAHTGRLTITPRPTGGLLIVVALPAPHETPPPGTPRRRLEREPEP
jgi:signal transduction histidine kinase